MNGADQAMQEPRLVKVNHFLNEIRDRAREINTRIDNMLDRTRGATPEVASEKRGIETAPCEGMMNSVEQNVEDINAKLATLQSKLSELESIM